MTSTPDGVSPSSESFLSNLSYDQHRLLCSSEESSFDNLAFLSQLDEIDKNRSLCRNCSNSSGRTATDSFKYLECPCSPSHPRSGRASAPSSRSNSASPSESFLGKSPSGQHSRLHINDFVSFSSPNFLSAINDIDPNHLISYKNSKNSKNSTSTRSDTLSYLEFSHKGSQLSSRRGQQPPCDYCCMVPVGAPCPKCKYIKTSMASAKPEKEKCSGCCDEQEYARQSNVKPVFINSSWGTFGHRNASGVKYHSELTHQSPCQNNSSNSQISQEKHSNDGNYETYSEYNILHTNEPSYRRRRKGIFATCRHCRHKKVKCDKIFPSCSTCQKLGRADTCTYDNNVVGSEKGIYSMVRDVLPHDTSGSSNVSSERRCCECHTTLPNNVATCLCDECTGLGVECLAHNTTGKNRYSAKDASDHSSINLPSPYDDLGIFDQRISGVMPDMLHPQRLAWTCCRCGYRNNPAAATACRGVSCSHFRCNACAGHS